MISFKLTLTPGFLLLSDTCQHALTRLDLCQTSVLVSCLRFGLKMALSRSFIFIFLAQAIFRNVQYTGVQSLAMIKACEGAQMGYRVPNSKSAIEQINFFCCHPK